MEYIKDFGSWNIRARALDNRAADFEFSEREVWWCSLGTNIGSEQDGKGEDFVRAVLILKKINKELVLILPATTKLRADTHDRIYIPLGGKDCQLLLSQMRTISSKRLIRRVQRLKSSMYLEIAIESAKYILPSIPKKNETPRESGESRAPEANVIEV